MELFVHFSFKKIALAVTLVSGGVLVGGGAVFAYQGHMYSALSELRSASYQLNAAVSDKRGHRVAAIGLVNRAIYQVQLGIHDGM
jgi:hypothetical protein